MLAVYAAQAAQSRGRQHADAQVAVPGEAFQIDRERIVRSSAFRRLVYKTQVFLNHEGDMYRTRLTHSLEVAQLGRRMAHLLGLNQDLTEAMALAHDLGHTPFGHAGQDALHDCVKAVDPVGAGFEHNVQSLRVVDVLEASFPGFDGLNLCFETREGILKHCPPLVARRLAAQGNGLGERFLNHTLPSLEAQLCDLVDAMTYIAHDLDDGERSGLLTWSQLREVPWLDELLMASEAAYPMLDDRRRLYDVLQRLQWAQVEDLLDTSRALIAQHRPDSAEAVRQCPRLIKFSPEMNQRHQAVKRFLFQALYRHPQVLEVTDRAKLVVTQLFEAYHAQPSLMLPPFADQSDTLVAVTDYIAGMTDRYAIKAHRALTGQHLFSSPTD